MPNNTERQPAITATLMHLSLLHPYLLAQHIRERTQKNHPSYNFSTVKSCSSLLSSAYLLVTASSYVTFIASTMFSFSTSIAVDESIFAFDLLVRSVPKRSMPRLLVLSVKGTRFSFGTGLLGRFVGR